MHAEAKGDWKMKSETQAEIQKRYLIPGPTAGNDLYDSWKMAAEIQRLQAKLDLNECNSGHKTLPLTLWDCPACHDVTKAKLKTAEDLLRKRTERIGKLEDDMAGLVSQVDQLKAWGDELRKAKAIVAEWEARWETEKKIAGSALSGMSEDLIQARTFGKIQADAAQAAERRINELQEEASRFYKADGSFERGLTPEAVIEKRIGAAQDLEAAKEEIKRLGQGEYARQTAPLRPEEMRPIREAMDEYDAMDPGSKEKDVALGKMERALEGLCQGRALVLSRSKRGLGVAAEEAIQMMMPISTKLRQIRMLDQSVDMPAAVGHVLEEHEAAIKRMRFVKLIADAAPEKGRPALELVSIARISIAKIDAWRKDDEQGLMAIEDLMAIRDDLEAALPEKGGARAS